jgi:drug/metabolite transporter (DMT)-like permease
MDRRQAGVILVVVSAFVFSTAGIFTKAVEAAAWDIIFWRGVSAASFTLIYLALRGMLIREVRSFGRTALVITLMMAAGTAAFIPAFKLTHVANVALIYGAAPLIAGVLSWVFLREFPTKTVAVASVIAFGGVALIVSGSYGGMALRGDMLALFMTLMMAGVVVLYRAFPLTTAALPAALSSVVLLPVAFVFGDPFAVSLEELPLLILFGLVFAVASVTLSEGARRLPSAETALLSVLEMPLAPLLALVLLAERPAMEVLVGGAIILGAVLWSQIRGKGGAKPQS